MFTVARLLSVCFFNFLVFLVVFRCTRLRFCSVGVVLWSSHAERVFSSRGRSFASMWVMTREAEVFLASRVFHFLESACKLSTLVLKSTLLHKGFFHTVGKHLCMRLSQPHGQNRLQKPLFLHAAGTSTYKDAIFTCGRLYRPLAKINSANKKINIQKSQTLAHHRSATSTLHAVAGGGSIAPAAPPPPAVVAPTGSVAPAARRRRRRQIRLPRRSLSSPPPDPRGAAGPPEAAKPSPPLRR